MWRIRAKLKSTKPLRHFLKGLQSALQHEKPELRFEVLTVPGNHDCYLPVEQIRLRDTLTTGFVSTINEPKQDQAFLSQLLEVQAHYNEFHAAFNSHSSSPWNGVWQQTLIEHRGWTIQCNMYNTALLSRRKEQQGSLYIPVESVAHDIVIDNPSMLSISIFHHSYLWLESNNVLKFRALIERTSDIALTGHQHYQHDYYKLNSTGERVLYLEGSALQDESYPQTSAFSVLVVDLERLEEQSITFRWAKTAYTQSESSLAAAQFQ